MTLSFMILQSLCPCVLKDRNGPSQCTLKLALRLFW